MFNLLKSYLFLYYYLYLLAFIIYIYTPLLYPTYQSITNIYQFCCKYTSTSVTPTLNAVRRLKTPERGSKIILSGGTLNIERETRKYERETRQNERDI